MPQEWVNFIGQVGFPIAVATYLLIRVESTIKELTRAVNLMAATIGVKNDGTK